MIPLSKTFEITRENDGFSLGNFKAGPEGKSVSDVLEVLKKQGLDGNLLEDDTTILTVGDLLSAGCIYKFRPSVHVSSAGL
jgi:hypothetical protein